MSSKDVKVLVVGGGLAGLAMSVHLGRLKVDHMVLDRGSVARRWREGFEEPPVAEARSCGSSSTDMVVSFLLRCAAAPGQPLRRGVEVIAAQPLADGCGFEVRTTEGRMTANAVVAATSPFQWPSAPDFAQPSAQLTQMHSAAYRSPEDLPLGAVLVVGAGPSGVRITDELRRSGRKVFLSLGRHERQPLRYRGRSLEWWSRALCEGKSARDDARDDVTVALGDERAVDFRRMAAEGVVLLGRAQAYLGGVMSFAPDLKRNLAAGDQSYLAFIVEADAYAARHGLDLPPEPEAPLAEADPECVSHPRLSLDLAKEGVRSIVWATGYGLDFSWLKIEALDAAGRPIHEAGISPVPGLFVLGQPTLLRRRTSFMEGVWSDAARLADHIAATVCDNACAGTRRFFSLAADPLGATKKMG